MLEEFNIVHQCMLVSWVNKKTQPSACSCQICCLMYLISELCFHASANLIFWLMLVCYFYLRKAIFSPFICCYCSMLNPETGREPRGNPCTCVKNITRNSHKLILGDPAAVRQQHYPLHHPDTQMIAYYYICNNKLILC